MLILAQEAKDTEEAKTHGLSQQQQKREAEEADIAQISAHNRALEEQLAKLQADFQS